MLCSIRANATHIVGGEIYYKIKNKTHRLYTVTMHLYVDCENGNIEAILQDSVAIIGLFDAGTRQYRGKEELRRVAPNRINSSYYKCVKPPTGVCVDEYVYQKDIVIDAGSNGMILAFQRCCRNNTISNISAPESTGATYWVKVPPHAVDNNSAIFQNLPPNYVCVNAPLVVDNSAIDPDGDSLVYELYQPYDGASRNAPRPDPPAPPPFRNVVWQTGYNTVNQMSGDPILAINRSTGELTVTPTITGQFVIGVKVIEYRDGKVVGETLRDYQVNVMNCEFDVIANFTTEKGASSGKAFVFECSDTVQFVDRSYKAVHYRWNFGDPTTDADTSNETDPWYIYPGNGNYKVTLKVKNELCEDEYSFTVKVRSKKTFQLGPDVVLCDDISHYFDSKAYDATSIDWSTGETSRAITVNDTGMYWATVAFGQCVWSDTAHVGAKPVSITDNKDSIFCVGDTIDYLVDAGFEGFRYEWRPGTKTDTFQTYRITKPDIYELVVYNKHCFKVDTIKVIRASEPEIPDVFYCNEFEHVVDPGSFEYGEYYWSTNSNDQSETFTQPGKYWYTLKQKHCISSDTFIIENSVVNLELGEDEHFCDEIDVTLDAGPNKVSYQWSTNATSQTIYVNTPGEYWVTGVDQFGCTRSDTVKFSLSNSPTINLGNDTSICVRSPITLAVQGSFAQYDWSTEETSATIDVMLEDEYTLEVTDSFGCTARDTVVIAVDPNALPNELFIPNAFSPNGDELNDVFPYSTHVPQSEYYVMVFTRWGEKVFDSREDGTQYWDGTYKGEMVPNQTFIYYVQYRACDGNVRIRKGTVNPLR